MKTRELEDYLSEPERYELHAAPLYRFDLDRREFFKVLGCGVVVLCLLETAEGQETGGRKGGRNGGQRPSDIGAWLHIGEDGTVKVFTGKTEVGQKIRTSLTQAVAEELRVPVASIQLVMADTELTPYDGGTAGSRTTPDMFPQLRRVAAAAREALLDLAVEHFKTERSSLTTAGGKITRAGGADAVTYGQLTKNQKLVKSVSDQVALTPSGQWKVIGTSVPHVEGRDQVTGKHRYTSDIRRPGMLHGKVLRPVAYEATIASIDTKAAEAMGGITVVRDGNFVGVTAPDTFQASKAVSALKAEWATKPQISHKELFASLKKNAGGGGSGGGGRGTGATKQGSMEQGLAGADHKLEHTYTIAYIAHTPLEPRAAVAEWNDGKLTVWTGTQRPFGVRNELSQAFGIGEDKVRVIVPDTGSGYGGKHTGEAALEAARLAKAAGKPVKLVWTREEEFTWAYFRPAGVIDIKAGVRHDGKLTAWEFHNYNAGGSAIRTPYDVPNQHTEFHGTRAPLRSGSYRGLASTANVFAREAHMDDLARLVKMDPLEFRRKNLKDARMLAVLDAVEKAFGWGQKTPAAGHGFGLACGTEKDSYVATCVEVSADPQTGAMKVLHAVSAFECGAVVNPDHLKNQIEGAMIMGLGGALFEAIQFENGRILNPHLADYRVPRFSDMPQIESVQVNRKDQNSRGAGETPIVGIAPAIRNAIVNATGIQLRALPMVPDGLKA